jgi:hypothetical protein
VKSKPADGLGLLLLSGKPKGSKSHEDDGESIVPEDDEKTLAAEGVLKAIKRGDAGALSRALEQHYASCQGEPAEASEEDDDSY